VPQRLRPGYTVRTMPESDDTLTLRGAVHHAGEPVQVWIEVQDDDLFLHDFVAAGRTRSDGSFELRFSRTAFNQQPWERQALPHLSLFVWHPAPADRRPPGDVPPSHHLRFPPTVFRGGGANLGALELTDGSPLAPSWGTWALRQLQTSRRPGRAWTLDQIQALSNEVAAWVADAVRRHRMPEVTLRIEALGGAMGRYSHVDRAIAVGSDWLARLDQDALRRLLAHEWGHAVAHAERDAEAPGDAVWVPGHLPSWAEALVASASLSIQPAALVDRMVEQAVSANHEGFAHYVEELVVRRHLPLSASPGRPLIDRAFAYNEKSDTASELIRAHVAEHDEHGLRYIGLSWYRHEYADGRRLRFRRGAASEILPACVLRFERLVRGEGRARYTPAIEP
jgi:hypothetical protein